MHQSQGLVEGAAGHGDARRLDHAQRPPPPDAFALAQLREVPAPRAARACRRRHRLGRDASSDVLRERARCTACAPKGASIQQPGWSGAMWAAMTSAAWRAL
jgi:hypothetical protein